MALKYGKRERQRMIDALEQEHATVEDAADAALLAAEEVFRQRAQFVVVGQVVAQDGVPVSPKDQEALKCSLGWYSTRGDAASAAQSLWYSTASGSEFRTWVLPVFHGTPAEFHQKRKAELAKAEEVAKVKAMEAMNARHEKAREAIIEELSGGKGSCANCEHIAADHLNLKAAKHCVSKWCDCPEFVVKK